MGQCYCRFHQGSAFMFSNLLQRHKREAKRTNPPPHAVAAKLISELPAHRHRSSMVAPKKLSKNAPVNPAAATAKKMPAGSEAPPKSAAIPPMSRVPAAVPAVPRGVIPPERPWRTTAHVVTRRGGLGLQRPSSVPHVSAVAAAIAPAATAKARGHAVRPWMTAASAATPPLAATWSQRRPARSRDRLARPPERGSRCVSAEAVTKNAPTTVTNGHPPPANRIVPAATAAHAPERVNAWRRDDTTATHPLPAAPARMRRVQSTIRVVRRGK
jgi:hypothetical protein